MLYIQTVVVFSFFSTTRGIISCILQQQKNNKYKSLDLHLDTELNLKY